MARASGPPGPNLVLYETTPQDRMTKSQVAFQFSAERLAESGLYFWTFTFREVLDIKDTRKRWNHLLTLMKREWPDLCGLRVFELHKKHGLHVHLLTNRYIRVERARDLATKAGWGRIHVCRAKPSAADYLAKYLSKEREPCLKRWRLWATFGEWEHSRVKNVALQTARARIWAVCKEKFGWSGNKGLFERSRLVEEIYLTAILENWQISKMEDSDPGESAASQDQKSIPTCSPHGRAAMNQLRNKSSRDDERKQQSCGESAI
ncbi:MAG: hypothetical protein SFU53_08050 [Terrimicrobiaceae bacterium]|nr:hypothetical protein [Terrimicrobiaceae bacterium]